MIDLSLKYLNEYSVDEIDNDPQTIVIMDLASDFFKQSKYLSKTRCLDLAYCLWNTERLMLSRIVYNNKIGFLIQKVPFDQKMFKAIVRQSYLNSLAKRKIPIQVLAKCIERPAKGS